MAFSNFLGANTYLIVDRVAYFKMENRIHFFTSIYSDSSKATLITSNEYYIQAGLERRELKAKVNALPTENLTVGDLYLVENTLLPHITNPWLLAKKENPLNDGSPSDGWSFWIPTIHEVFYMSDANYYTISDLEVGTLSKVSELTDDPRVWNTWFAKEPVNDNSIVGQCYLYLKHRPEYAGVVDC